jgi:hypothetical protein
LRIRSIKPEFWRSDDITGLPIATRLTFIGLWSYVDDNGVGADKIVSIVADLYADDFSRDPLETLKRVTEDLQRLSSGGQVLRFKAVHNGSLKDLLYITQWKHHQIVNHPSKGHQFPLPPAEMVDAAKGLVSVSRESQETLTHEQGNRGAGEWSRGTEEPPYPPDDEPPPPQPPTKPTGSEKTLARIAAIPGRSVGAYRIAEAFSASLPVPIEDDLLSGIGVQIDKCLKRGIPPPAIATGLKAWTDSDSWSPTQIPNFVHKANNGGGNGKPTAKALGYDTALQELLQEVTTL